MNRKLLTGVGIAGVLIIGVVIGSLTLGPVFAQASHNANQTQTTVQDQKDGSNEANGTDVEQVDEQNEVDEQLPLGEVKITPEQARAAALSQFPEATIIKVELENENGSLVYSVALTVNGKAYDVKVDANNGNIVRAEADEPEGQNNDINEQNGQEADGD
jgi:uncharacterized membrane protein YkoI